MQDSVFRLNAVGVGPNSLPNDIPPPQLGTCDSATNTSPTPTITTTKLDRCTIFRRNTITNNNNLTTPANGTSGQLPWGVGLEPVGTYGDLFTDNTISGNRNFGILGVENPVPFPPTADTIYFQLAGNAFTNNKVSGGGYADIALAGGLFGAKQSVDNCFDEQRLQDLAAGRPLAVVVLARPDAEPGPGRRGPAARDRDQAAGRVAGAQGRGPAGPARAADDAEPVRRRAEEPALPLAHQRWWTSGAIRSS